MGSWINQLYLINRILSGGADFRETDFLSGEEKLALADELLKNAPRAGNHFVNVVSALGYLVPRVPEWQRAPIVMGLFKLLSVPGMALGRAGYQVFDAELVRSLNNETRLQLAREFTQLAKNSEYMTREACVWGLARVVPFLHDVAVKECTYEMFIAATDPVLRASGLEALCIVIYQITREQRADVVSFFADTFGRHESPALKRLCLEFLTRVTAALPQADRSRIAEAVAPALLHTDPEVAAMAIDYFAQVLGVLNPEQRFYFTDLVASLANDLALKGFVRVALERMLPQLATEQEREIICRYLAGATTGKTQPAAVSVPAFLHEY